MLRCHVLRLSAFRDPQINRMTTRLTLTTTPKIPDQTADYFMRVLQLGPEEEDEGGKKGSDLPALWLEKGQVCYRAICVCLCVFGGTAEFNSSRSLYQAFDSEEGDGRTASSAAEAAVVSSGERASDLKDLDLGYRVPRWYQVRCLRVLTHTRVTTRKVTAAGG